MLPHRRQGKRFIGGQGTAPVARWATTRVAPTIHIHGLVCCVYSRGDPCGRPASAANLQPVNLTPMGRDECCPYLDSLFLPPCKKMTPTLGDGVCFMCLQPARADPNAWACSPCWLQKNETHPTQRNSLKIPSCSGILSDENTAAGATVSCYRKEGGRIHLLSIVLLMSVSYGN